MSIKIPDSVNRSLHMTALKMKQASPKLFLIGGCIGVGVSFVMACKASMEVPSIINDMKEDVENIKKVAEEKPEEYTEDDVDKAIKYTYGQVGIKMVKLYAPSVIIASISMGCIIGSHEILTKRNGVLCAAYAGLEKKFNEYRDRVREKYGDEAEEDIRFNVKKEEVKVKETDPKTGKEKEVKKKVRTGEPSMYARFFDEACPYWKKDIEENLEFVKRQQRYANERLRSRGYLFLNEVYEMFNIPPILEGQYMGWVFGEDGSGYVDFGLRDISNRSARRFVNGEDRSFLMDFNCEYILTKFV